MSHTVILVKQNAFLGKGGEHGLNTCFLRVYDLTYGLLLTLLFAVLKSVFSSQICTYNDERYI